jgi:hypothetical protein
VALSRWEQIGLRQPSDQHLPRLDPVLLPEDTEYGKGRVGKKAILARPSLSRERDYDLELFARGHHSLSSFLKKPNSPGSPNFSQRLQS